MAQWGTPTRTEIVKRAGDGFLEVCEVMGRTLPVLYVTGGPEAMGRQYGELLGARIDGLLKLMTGLFTSQGMPEAMAHRLLNAAWEMLAPHVPERFNAEMAAIVEGARASGANVGIDDLRRIVATTNFDLYRREERLGEFLDEESLALLARAQGGEAPPPASCTMFAAWGDRTVDRKLFALRNLDWISQTGMHEGRLVTVYRPDEGCAFVTMGYAGLSGALAGMNEEGVSFSQIGAFSVREELDGVPWVFMARRVLEEARTLEEGAAIVEDARHTIGFNFLVSHGDPRHLGTPEFEPGAIAFETNCECCEAFRDDDPKEHGAVWVDSEGTEHPYGLPLKEAIARADTAFGEKTRALQATDNGPGEPANTGNPQEDTHGNSYLSCHKPMHDMLRAYETGGEYVFPVRGAKVIDAGPPRKVGAEEALNIAATVAHNVERLDDNDWNVMSVVYAPTDLDFWVAYESCDEAGNWLNAPDSGYAKLNLRELIGG